ncbi:MAG: hypothetical protein J7L44_03600, partial [Candidatus Diapherotrites archaeon]|nr:hypothetical protein [Candidatus Diapherotrites archaeon]
TIVKVIDEDGLPVKDAKVMFRYKDSDTIVELSSEQNYKLSDANGIAEFILGDIQQEIYPYVVKYPAFGGSAELAKTISASETNYFEVVIKIGKSTLNIRALKSDGTLLQESYFEVFSASDNSSVSQGRVPMVDGTYSYELKALRDVYVVVSHEGYLSYQSEVIRLMPNETYTIDALMLKEDELAEPKIEFLGVFKGGEAVESLNAGNEYEFRFRVMFPEKDRLDKAGFHFRVGDKEELALEPMFIKEVKANADTIIRGKTYRPKKSQALEELAEDKAKWVTLEWNKSRSGSYAISIVVRVKGDIAPKTKMNFYYRSYAVIGSRYIRVPADKELGELESTANKDALYAECYTLTYFEGSESACLEPFCITGYWLYDKQQDVFVSEPYKIAIFGDYNLIFDLMNNSPKDYNSITLIIKNTTNKKPDSALALKNVIVMLGDKKIELVPEENEVKTELSGFTYAKQLSANIQFEAKDETTTSITIELIADKHVVFSKEIEFVVYSEESLILKVEPEELVAFKPYELKVTVEDSSGTSIKDALVTLTREAPDGTSEVMQKTTDVEGLASFEVPDSYPKTKLTIEAEKIGYVPASVTMLIDENVARVLPEYLRLSLDTISKTEESIPISIENTSGTELMVKQIRFVGNFKGLLDKAAMNANASMHAGKTIAPLESLDIALKVILSEEAEMLLQSNESLTGSIEIVVYAAKYNSEYAMLIPLTVEINLGDLPDNSPCVSISGPEIPEWRVTTINNMARTEFEISNLCVKGGKAIDLENLMVKLDWAEHSKRAGIIEIAITAPDGTTASRVLKPGRWEKLFNTFRNVDYGTYKGVITFTPGQGYVGETASFTVRLDAQTKTAKGLKFVGADAAINASILILNLKDCINYPKEKVVMQADQEGITFTVDANMCNTDVFVVLCKDDSKCRGGTQEGGITLMPAEEIKLSKVQPSKTVTVYRESIPGQYGITVYAKTAETDYEHVGTIDLIVEPESHKYFSLSRYEVTLSNSTNWHDSVELINKMWTEKVDITAKLCTACKDPEKLPDYCIMNKALEQSAKERGLDPGKVLAAASVGTGVGYLTIEALSAAGAGALATVVLPLAIGILAFWGVMALLEGPQCNTEMATYPFQDYVINLPKDIKGLSLQYVPFNVTYGDESEHSYSENMQMILLKFENNARKQFEEPKYGILEIKAKEHIHNDPTHKHAKMSRDKADFGDFNVPDTEVKEYSQKFHLKFNTRESFGAEMLAVEGAETCMLGTKVGITGEKALPKIKLDWSWNAIEWNSCDADNEQAVYCDATQFSIALSKRLHMLDEFFRANGHKFECPAHPYKKSLEELVEKVNEEKSQREVEIGKIGASKIELELDESSATAKLIATIENKTAEQQTAKVRFILKKDGYSKECNKEITVGANEHVLADCTFENLERSDTQAYFASATVVEASTDNIDTGSVVLGFVFASQQQTCWLPYSTRKIEGRPALLYFIDRNIQNWQNYINVREIKWPEDWPGSTVQEKIEFLKKLIEFDALLMRDGFSADFRKDFAEYYKDQTFFEVPGWFTGRDGMQAYFANPKIMRFVVGENTSTLPGPGKYHIFLDMNFTDGFAFFRGGKPNGQINVRFRKLDKAEPDSIFYYWPIDGMVGMNSNDGRNGYGANYINTNSELIICSYGSTQLKTDAGKGGNALITVETSLRDSLEYTHLNPQTRGNILEAEIGEERLSLVFSPNIATPVIMKVSGEKGKQIEARYSLLENHKPVTEPETLAYWSGINKCKDFSGMPLKEAFSYYPDEKIEKGIYGLYWDNSVYSGNIYLYSLFFTPANRNYALSAVSSNVAFITPELSEQTTMELKGTKETRVDSIENIFELIAEKRVCVSANNNKISFWWNPKGLIETDAFQILANKKCPQGG